MKPNEYPITTPSHKNHLSLFSSYKVFVSDSSSGHGTQFCNPHSKLLLEKSLDHSWCPFDHQLESYQWACCYSHSKQTIVATLQVIVELSLIICYVTSPNSIGSLSHQDLSVHSHGGCYVRCWEVLDPSICLMMLGSHQKVVSLTSLTESRVQGYGLTDLVSTSSNSLSNHYTLARWWKY